VTASSLLGSEALVELGQQHLLIRPHDAAAALKVGEVVVIGGSSVL
jgi:hypothetical protein